MKRLTALLLAALFLVLGTGCSAKWESEKAVSRMLSALQDGKLNKAAGYTAQGSLGDLTKTRASKNFYKAMFSTIQYVVADSTVDGNSAVVTVSVTMVDMAVILSGASLDLLGRTLDGEWVNDKAFYKEITALIKGGETARVSTTVKVHLTQIDGKWKVDMAGSGYYAEAITGGLGQLIGP